jgi:RNA polymerase sigma-70 factor, ECF subfamily
MGQASGELSDEPGVTRAGPSGASPRLTFDDLYEAWFEDVGRWVRAMGGAAADRDDLVQDVFVVVHRRLPDFDGVNLAGWLYQITRRRVRDFRRLAWFKQLLFRDGRALDATKSGAIGPEGELELREQRRLLDRLLMDLPEDQRVAFVLFEIEGHSGDEIASFQGVPLNTVWARVHTARKKLSSRLGKMDRSNRRVS